MTDKIVSYLVSALIVIGLMAGGVILFGQPLLSKAAQMVFKTDCKTASATSTLNYMTPGTATTTVTCAMGGDGANTAVLAIQVNASSSLTAYNIYAEESMDGQDWYPIAVNQSASTTNPYHLGARAYSSFLFASSTSGGGTLGNLFGASTTFEGFQAVANRNHYTIDIPVRMQRVRAYAALPIGSANGAIWMQIIPRVEI